MFRLAFVSFITLRVIACPIFCAGNDVAARTAGSESSVCCTCACSESQNEPCQGNEVPPSDSPCPCDTTCVCQVAPELNNRTAAADFELLLEIASVSFETLESPGILVASYPEHPCGHDLPDGRSVRIAHASLLL